MKRRLPARKRGSHKDSGKMSLTAIICIVILLMFLAFWASLTLLQAIYTKDSVENSQFAKFEACEERVKELTGGSPVFHRESNKIVDNGVVVTGKVDTSFDKEQEKIQTYTCRVEVVDGKLVATVDSVE